MTRWATGRAPLGGGDVVVLEAICAGAETIDAIAASAKVERFVAVQAIRRLITAGKVWKQGATRNAKFFASRKRHRMGA